jgi:hypothetical protein
VTARSHGRLVASAIAVAACTPSSSRQAASDAGAPPADVPAAVTARSSADSGAGAFPHVEEAPPPTYLGARRARLTRIDDEPGLAKNAGAVREHFDGGLPAVMDLQAAVLGGGRQALLLEAAAVERNPIALLVDAQGAALWIKQHPAGGIAPPARPFALAPRPDEGVALFVYDEPTKLLAGRMWAEDGAAYAELIVLGLARCDALSAAWWPGHGWIVVAAFPGGARAQLVSEEGSPAWGPDGVPVGEAWRAPAAATIVIDAPSSTWLLLQRAARAGVDHVVALRYGALGERITRTAVDLGPAPAAGTADRVEASVVQPGVVRVTVGSKSVETRVESIR